MKKLLTLLLLYAFLSIQVPVWAVAPLKQMPLQRNYSTQESYLNQSGIFGAYGEMINTDTARSQILSIIYELSRVFLLCQSNLVITV